MPGRICEAFLLFPSASLALHKFILFLGAADAKQFLKGQPSLASDSMDVVCPTNRYNAVTLCLGKHRSSVEVPEAILPLLLHVCQSYNRILAAMAQW